MFTVIEFWTESGGGQQQTVAYSKESKDEAMSSYHYVLHQAAVSSKYKHGAFVIDADGKYLARECYTHAQEIIEENTDA